VPTWCPFRLQFYCNGHSWLAGQLTAGGVGFTLADNAFLRIDDWERAQALADTLSPDHMHRILDHYAQQCCPVLDVFAQSYHWSFMQVEYATDLVFRTPAILKPLHEQLSRQAILTVTAYRVILAEEGCFDRSEASHAVSLCDMHAKYADVPPTVEILSYFDQLPGDLFDLPTGNRRPATPVKEAAE
jgi:hypothetical protein